MTANLRFCRRSLLVSAALLVAVTLVVAAGIIPPVKSDTSPAAGPERAVPAFWVNVAITLLVAAILGAIAIRTRGRSRLSTTSLVVAACLVLLLAVALTTAAFAFRAHGPPLHTATILLFFCAAADLMAALLVITAALRYPKRT